MNRRRLTRIFWFGAAATLVVAALISLVAVLRGSFSDTDGRILGSLAALLFSGGASLAGLTLADRGPARPLGWAVSAASPLALLLQLRAVWTDFEGEENVWKLAWSATLVLVVGLVSATALLLAHRPVLVRLAAGAGVLATLTGALSIYAIWDQSPPDTVAKAIGAGWILTALAYFLGPVLQRWSSVGDEARGDRVLAALGDVELVATLHPASGILVEERPHGKERLVLRSRS